MRSLLTMGGQACVLYGAAELSRDTDVVVPPAALRDEQEREQEADRVSWAPLRVGLEALHRARR